LPTENPSRELILQRIRAGLRTPVAQCPPTSSDVVIFEPIRNPLERFQQECAANLMECTVTADLNASAAQLARILNSLPQGEVFLQDDLSLRQLIELTHTQRRLRWSSEGAPREASEATVSLAEALIAQTGSVLVTAQCGGRGASIVAPCHIVYAHVAQLVPYLETALGNLFRSGKLGHNSFGCVISGSSRTADIEKILVQGAHGPRRLAVILQMGA
jgi:L-lactate dehydrogenase complex protein LldG